jgi:hypothetical protein
MTDDEKRAWKFALSMRGQYILAQALSVAIETMSKVPHPHTEVSNIEDMKYILESLFPVFAGLHNLNKGGLDGTTVGSTNRGKRR